MIDNNDIIYKSKYSNYKGCKLLESENHFLLVNNIDI